MHLNNIGILLLNLGTPDAPDARSVGKYLRQFLLDPKVITLPAILRWALVCGVIVPFRAKKSARAYQEIWQEEGSPLLINSRKFAANLAKDFHIALGMRYGNPSIACAVEELGDVDRIIIFPMFPQYSTAATGSAIGEAIRVILSKQNVPEIEVIKDFYQEPNYIKALSESISPYITNNFEYLLTSYHGLPQKVAGLYPQHCYKTSELLANKLGLRSEQWGVSFQSRLGRLPWVRPYTDEVLPELYAKGVKNLLMASPSFVADCLESLEEINIGIREQWLELGGKSFEFVPCLNARAEWAKDLLDAKINSKNLEKVIDAVDS